jgi:hypothetical protein
MGSPCPSPETLEAYARGSLASAAAESIELHLHGCRSCAESLESLTRSQLLGLLGDLQSAPPIAQAPPASPVLDTLIRQASLSPDPSWGSDDEASSSQVLQRLDPPLSAGSLGVFAGYEILDLAGSGGMGLVLKARDRTLHRTVAIKVLYPQRGEDRLSNRFLAEARAVAAMHHDHIVTVYHAGTEKGLSYLVMPFHGEGTLADLLTTTPRLTWEQVARVGMQLAQALAAMHSVDILHRDIKPSNVLLEQGLERVRLADFGLAKPIHGPASEPTQRSIAGTPHYMAPEQARGEPMDARSDLFALGALLHRLATGTTLYEGDSSAEVLQLAAQGNLKPIRERAPEIPAHLGAIIDRLVAPRPEDRFSSADEVSHALSRVLQPGRRIAVWVGRAAAVLAGLSLVAGSALAGLELTGRTTFINARLCDRNGHEFFIRGRWGTFATLPDAVQACRDGETVELRFSGEKVIDSFRVGTKSMTLRAADRYVPVLVATNESQPFILADAPLTIEGVTLLRRSNRINIFPLISAEGAPISLLNCRVLRAQSQGETMLLRAGKLVPSDDGARTHRPLIVLSAGSSALLRNCLVLARQGSGVGIWGAPKGPIKVQTENCLFIIHRAYTLRPDAGSEAEFRTSNSVIVTRNLLDLDDAKNLNRVVAIWDSTLIDRSDGALLRLTDHVPGEWPAALQWTETNVVYAGKGVFLADRRGRQIDSESAWNELMQLKPGNHTLSEVDLFQHARIRSSLRVSATDVEIDEAASERQLVGFTPQHVGEGDPYELFRRKPAYQDWRNDVETTARLWSESNRGRR